MYIAPIDVKIVKSEKACKLREKYHELFGEWIPFNYDDFPGTEKLLGGEQYIQVLEECIRTGTPCKYDEDGYRIIDN